MGERSAEFAKTAAGRGEGARIRIYPWLREYGYGSGRLRVVRVCDQGDEKRRESRV